MRWVFLLLIAAVGMADEARCQTLAAPMQVPNIQFLDCRGNGNSPCPPLSGGFLFSYAAGTNTPLATCQTTTLSGTACATPNANPVILNSTGYNSAGSGSTGIWPLPARCYKFVLQDSSSVTIWTVDNVCNQTGLLQAALAASTGAGLIGFSQTASYGAGTVGAKLLQFFVDSSSNTALGKATVLPNLTSGTNNTAVGDSACKQNTTGAFNVCLGDHALENNSSGMVNTAVGHGALQNETTGGSNTAVGNDAGQSITTGFDNVANGYASLANLIDGSRNVAIGTNSMLNNIHGIQSTAVGDGALGFYASDAGTAVGYEALTSLCANGLVMPMPGSCNTAGRNTAVGWEALSDLLNSPDNTAVGYSAMILPTVGSQNTAVGSFALSMGQGTTCLPTCATINNNTAIGAYAMSASNYSGNDNTAVGNQAGLVVSTGSNIVAVGSKSLLVDTTGTHNTAVGYATLTNDVTGSDNTAVGLEALGAATGSQSTAVGSGALSDVTSGQNNTGMGFNAGTTITTGGANTVIGETADVDSGAAVHRTVIGQGAVGKQDNSVTLGLPTEPHIFGTQSGAFDSKLQNGQCTFLLTSDTTLQVRCKGSDGTVRANTLTLM